MTITTIPALDRTSGSFKSDVDTFFGVQLPAFAAEANALAADVTAQQTTASTAATTATTQAGISTTQAGESASSAAAAAQSAVDADAAAATSTTQAGNAATSASSAATGAATATTQAGIATAKAAEAAASAAGISDGPVTSVNGMTGVVTIQLSTVNVTGNLSPYATQTTILTITNYDSATAYGVTATGGTVSRSGDTITYVAGATAGVFAITITAGTATRSVPITVQAATVAAPSITAPANGATNIGQSPTITTAAFASIGLTDTHLDTDWEVRTETGGAGTLIASSLADSTNKLSWAVPGGLLAVATTYYARARHRGTTLGAGAWSESSFTTAAAFTPTVPGTAYQGGFYAGRVTIGGSTYAIIVAPKASGHSASKTWKATNDTTSGTLSLNNGLANSNAMNDANHPAAQFCRGLSIGGYTDWYLPSRDELEVCYRYLKPTTTANTVYASRLENFGASGYNGVDAQGNGDNDNSSPAGAAYTTGDPAMTAATAFQSGGAECFESQYYWASTEFTATRAWGQDFSNGNQNNNAKTTAYYVRAVRKVLI